MNKPTPPTYAAREQIIQMQRWVASFSDESKKHPDVKNLIDKLLQTRNALEKIGSHFP
jgi:hypothetical protein